MPELPEVETLKNSLKDKLIGLIIENVELKRDNLCYKLSPLLATEISNTNILNVRRRAKYLIIDFGNYYSLVIHLGMSGRFTVQPANYKIQKHDHVIFDLNNCEKLIFNDTRRFGMVYSFKTNFLEEEFFHNLGIEPLSDLLTLGYLKSKLITRKIPIKKLIMDNRVIVGVGNIYASESLHLARIHPNKLGSDLKDDEIENLIKSIREVLTKAITAGGTTLKDFVNGDSKPGYFTQQLTVYGREGQKCLNCSSTILKTKHSGRSTFYCKTCQYT
ncbi:MAG: bifunctional DNA-formamidopyrimidine glycosylase/DNA-(apurinic or apyrimidinic site) lyase [Rickettsia endosymbiont of Ixodes persulcatus]|nr:bifunctional DNA-formamidopyrimidine glycosylase/DNA-(apurinic or apyrimidinic site) lyase [Rickettsia endosymbiont of Ixodes persulcatus]MCZ6902917.1 bifunctional DNA-formamidopyrimidine glycosylase/DNA-(apurinic or apyrimidinic site) lyase [Rickettsia endosymbiont of Ixodes persulcatus]MCZ6908899.1 bifunctional DNA-formamidopyrimidine glycosylase/DNA-(apurinic or apyrimidinic site) lyase [Rickettsia endosymbiont of Ixodes persulcatus]MCZ6910023.1 bifunctional DNA-formamidopyrimidine glycosy